MKLQSTLNIADHDAFYKELIDSQRDMNDEQAELMNAKLIIILANHIGDRGVLRAAIRKAGGKIDA
jgi:hypothetical protein